MTKIIVIQVRRYFFRLILIGNYQVSDLHKPSKVDNVNNKNIKVIPANIEIIIQHPQNIYLHSQLINLSNLYMNLKYTNPKCPFS